jgi:HlyD family secretion protein
VCSSDLISIVRSIDVKIGQRVRQGDLLARLDPTFTTADLTALQTQGQSLQVEVDRLRAEADGLPYKGDATSAGRLQADLYDQRQGERRNKIEAYRQKISGLETATKKAQDEIRSYGERARYAAELLQRREEAERLGVGSKLNTLAARDSKVEAERALAGAMAAASSAKKDMDALIAERDGVIQTSKFETSNQLNDAKRKLDDVREQISKAQRKRDLIDLRADRNAVVQNIANVSVGSVLSGAEPFLTLVPDDATMEIDAAVKSSEVGFVRVGDPVTIKFEAYSFYQHGFAEGRVRVISPDSMVNPMEGPEKNKIDSLASTLGSNVYRVKVAIENFKMTNLPKDFSLQPGLGAEVDVIVGKRTVMSYLLSRFVPALTEGMREP